MNRLRIVHSTTYRYSEPVAFGLHRLVLRPREGHDIQIESHDLRITPEASVSWHRDLFGNSVALAQFSGQSLTLEIANNVVVVRREDVASMGLLAMSPMVYPLRYSELETAMVNAYRMPVYGEESRELTHWAATTFHPHDGADAAHLVREIMLWIYQSIQYRRREDRGVQTPLDTLKLLSGSCRDMATLMLEALRVMGFAARFASGYLDSASSSAGLAATHAWTEVYFPDYGWIGCDPTIGETTSHKHIVTGVSSHPRGVMPVSGAYSGLPDVYLGMAVSVKIERLEAGGHLPSVAML